MPKRKDLKTILVVGAGPIIIGQACEFDYSGTQACKALREEGYKVVLVNSNPATIMTDPEYADVTYIEPLTIEALEKIISKEKDKTRGSLLKITNDKIQPIKECYADIGTKISLKDIFYKYLKSIQISINR